MAIRKLVQKEPWFGPVAHVYDEAMDKAIKRDRRR
jgi:hypothetical protein